MTTIPGDQLPRTKRNKRPAISNLVQRVVTGLVALPIVLLAANAGGWWFVAVVSLLAAVGVMEFCLLGRSRDIEGNAVIGAIMAVAVVMGIHLQAPVLWLGTVAVGLVSAFASEILHAQAGIRQAFVRTLMTLAAILYVAYPASLLVAVRDLPNGLMWLLVILFVTWGTDSFAYIGGRLWGRTKLAPVISPKKTLEGAVIGVIAGIVLGATVLGLGEQFTLLAMVPVAVGPLLAILGDLVESGLKRLFLVKDSRLMGFDILPGHGGVLDRVDGLILVTVCTYFYLALTGLPW